MTLTHEDLKTLRRPFTPDEHEFLKGMTYITEDAITTRIEDVDPAWSLDVLSISNRDSVVTCLARLTINGVWRDGVGMSAITMSSDGKREVNEAEKSAATDALKRAARLFGIGRYLLSLPDDVKDEASLARYLNGNAQTPPKQAATARKSNAPVQRGTTIAETPEDAPESENLRDVVLTAVTVEKNETTGNRRMRFVTADNLQSVFSWTRQPFITGGWCDERDWMEPNIYTLPAPAPAKVKWNATENGGYWTVESVDPFQPDFFNQPVMNASAVTHDTTPSYEIDDPLKGEMLELTFVQIRSGKRFQWTGHAEFEGEPIRVLLYKEDEIAVRKAGYDTAQWDQPNGQRYTVEGISVITAMVKEGRKLVSVWDHKHGRHVEVEGR